ncbi:DUF2155 domain-containing protein [Enterovirga sp.]|jgi:hypothetical protein|uniref:DUF2155 domain-containing protein n=1 Tax=Enterovirga sp. TaxID=2026350 RepID=UPI00262FAD66|nr:DUF2155 domain-containing protein [Enterovirga sp.]MDB5592677.1 hypothetical protein [Enterovirga sp.]
MRIRSSRLFALTLAGICLSGPALADKIKNPTAIFNGLDKITGRIISFEVAVDETVQFGALQITPKVCFSRPPTESPQTDAFLEVDEVTLDNQYRRIFSGWMFAASPGLHGIEHAVYDVWLTECKGGTAVIADKKDDEPPVTTAQQPARRGTTGGRTARRNSQGQIDVDAPRGVEVRPSQQPSRRFYPTNQGQPQGQYGGFNPGR